MPGGTSTGEPQHDDSVALGPLQYDPVSPAPTISVYSPDSGANVVLKPSGKGSKAVLTMEQAVEAKAQTIRLLRAREAGQNACDVAVAIADVEASCITELSEASRTQTTCFQLKCVCGESLQLYRPDKLRDHFLTATHRKKKSNLSKQAVMPEPSSHSEE